MTSCFRAASHFETSAQNDPMSFKVLSPIWSYVNENETNFVHVCKNQKCKILKNKKQKNKQTKNWSGDMVKGTIPPNVALICLPCSERTGFMDDGWKDVGRPCDDSSFAVQ